MADDAIAEVADTGQQQLVIAKGNTKAFEFLKLPPEIRNKIYWNVLVVQQDWYSFIRPPLTLFSQPPLTLVNKQIRSESLPMFYGNNKFTVKCVETDDNESIWKFSQLRKRWKTPAQVPGISTLPNFGLITKLDLEYSFSDETETESGVDFTFEMRDKKPDHPLLFKYRIVGRCGERAKAFANISQICYRVLRKTGMDMDWSAEDPLMARVLEAFGKVVKSLLFFARKCPLAAGWVGIVASAYDLDNDDLWETLRAGLLVFDSPASGQTASESDDWSSESSGSEESGSEGYGMDETGSEGSGSEEADSEEGGD